LEIPIFFFVFQTPNDCQLDDIFMEKLAQITNKDIVIAISQSGETADTMAAIKLAKERVKKIEGC